MSTTPTCPSSAASTTCKRSSLSIWLLRLDLASIVSYSSVPQLNKRNLGSPSLAVLPVGLQHESSRLVGEVQRIFDGQYAADSQLEYLSSHCNTTPFEESSEMSSIPSALAGRTKHWLDSLGSVRLGSSAKPQRLAA
jgi:hypothetical protein